MTIAGRDDRPERALGTTVERTPGRVVVRVAQRAPFELNPTAFALWELCDGKTTVAEMIAAVCDLFAISGEQAERDVTSAIRRLRTADLVR